jgi:hypothetical protein
MPSQFPKRNHLLLFILIKDEAAPKVHMVHSDLGAEVVYKTIMGPLGPLPISSHSILCIHWHSATFSCLFDVNSQS